MKLLLAGATGLVGGLFQSHAQSLGHKVVTVGRRASGKSDEEIISDFSTVPVLPEAEAAVCALGTTIRAAGSREAFYAIDHDAVLKFAQGALDAGCRHCLVVTAIGANPDARVFYSRVKGETERDLVALDFDRLDILQPGLLLGARAERRPVERFLMAISPITDLAMVGNMQRYRSIEATAVARALLSLCEAQAPGVFRHNNTAMRNAALRVT